MPFKYLISIAKITKCKQQSVIELMSCDKSQTFSSFIL